MNLVAELLERHAAPPRTGKSAARNGWWQCPLLALVANAQSNQCDYSGRETFYEVECNEIDAWKRLKCGPNGSLGKRK
jgi:hypothetical protein